MHIFYSNNEHLEYNTHLSFTVFSIEIYFINLQLISLIHIQVSSSCLQSCFRKIAVNELILRPLPTNPALFPEKF